MGVFSGDSAWVVDGVLNVDQARFDYMDLCVDLYQKDLTAYANQWSTPWYRAMAGEVPILTADIQNYADDSVNVWDATEFAEATKGMDTTTVFAFGLPSWGVLTMRDNVGDTAPVCGASARDLPPDLTVVPISVFLPVQPQRYRMGVCKILYIK